MKVLMLNAYFEPEQIAFTHLEKDLLYAFVNEGFQIDVITPIPTRGIDYHTRKEYSKKKYEEMYNGAVKVYRFWAPQENRNPITRAFRYFWCNLREYQIGKRFMDADTIFAGSTPPTQGLVAAFVKRYIQKKGKKIKLIYNLQDIFPDSLVNAKMTKKGSLIWKIGRKIEYFTYRNADRIIVISDDFKRNILQKDVPEEKVIVIPNWIDSNTVYPVNKEDNILFERFNILRDKFYVCYSGNIGHSQNIELLLEAAQRIQKINEDIIFIFIGAGAEKENLLAVIEKRKISNVKVFPLQPYDDIAHVFSLGDADLVISKKGIGGSSVPSKTWSIMASGRPILASFDADSELVNLIRKTQSGIFVDADDIDGFVEAVIKLYGNDSGRMQMGNNGREYVRENLSKETCTQKYIETFFATAKR